MRRMIVTSQSEPNAAAMPEALHEGDRRAESLDRVINALKNEIELKRELARNSVLTIIDRENNHATANPQRQPHENTDSRFNQFSAPSGEE